jgi:hypothetical protein
LPGPIAITEYFAICMIVLVTAGQLALTETWGIWAATLLKL